MTDDSMDGSSEGPSKQLPYFSKLLSGSSLLQIHVSAGKSLPKDGAKEFAPTNSWMELKQIQCALDERKELLDEERVDKWSCLAGAVWNHKKKLAEVTRRAGRHFQTLGFEKEGKLYLYPEEALYLLETNSLELDFGGVSVSIQQGYSLLLGPSTGCELNEYRTYSHLMRQGYRLLRFTNQIVHTKYERTIRLDQHAHVKRNHPGTAGKNVPNSPLKPSLNQATIVENHGFTKEPENEVTSINAEETPETSTPEENQGEEFQTLQDTHKETCLLENSEPSEKTNEDLTNSNGINQTINHTQGEESDKPCGNQEITDEVHNKTKVQDTEKDNNADQCKGSQQDNKVLIGNDDLKKRAYDIAECLLSMGSALVDNGEETETVESLAATLESEIIKLLQGSQLDTDVSVDDLAAVASSAASTIITHVSKDENEDVAEDSDKEGNAEANEENSEDSEPTEKLTKPFPSSNSTNVEPVCQSIDSNGSDDDTMGMVVMMSNKNEDSNEAEKNEGSQHMKRRASSEENVASKKAKKVDNYEDDVEILDYVPEVKHVELVDLSDESSMDTSHDSKVNEGDSNSIEIIDVGDSSSSSSSSECTSSESNSSLVIIEERTGSNCGYSWDVERREILEIIPNMHNFKEIIVKPARFDLLPENVRPQRHLYRINRQRLVKDGRSSAHSTDSQEEDLMDEPVSYSAPPFSSPTNQRPPFNYAPHASMPQSMWQPQPGMPLPINPVEAVQAIAHMVLPMLGLPANAIPHQQISSWVPNNAWFPHRPWGPRRGGRRPRGIRGTRGMVPRHSQQPFRGNDFHCPRARSYGLRRSPRRPYRGRGPYRNWQHSSHVQVHPDEFPMNEMLPLQSTSHAPTYEPEKTQGPSSWRQVKARRSAKDNQRGRYFNPPKKYNHMRDLLDENQRADVSDSSPENANIKTESESSDEDSMSENMNENDNNENNSSLGNTDESCSSPTQLKPLLSPRDCTDFESVFKSVQVIKEADTQCLVSTIYDHRLKPQYDLFSPNKPFRKGNPPVPDFHLCIMGASDEVPEPGEIRALMEALGDSVPVMFAVVSPDTISFFQICDVSLPSVTG